MGLKILVHDYAGHPFQVQLSRELARRGHEVLHLFAGSIVTPRGELSRVEDDPESFQISGIFLDHLIDKQSYLKRLIQERTYGRRLAQAIIAKSPDIVLSGNTPLDAQAMALSATKQVNGRFVFWLQDIYSVAIRTLLAKKFGVFGSAVGGYYGNVERRLLKSSDAIVPISDDFLQVLARWGIDKRRTTVIPNWASLAEIPPGNKDNPWARRHGLEHRFCFLYSGTLGMKHNPETLIQLALRFPDDDTRIVVVSEGGGADFVRERASALGLRNILVLGFQPYEELADVFASADVLMAILEPESGVFSVPSKVLSYLCASRSLLLSVPGTNLAARIVAESGAGLVTDPMSPQQFVDAAIRLQRDAELRRSMARSALEYAQFHFNISSICDHFEMIFNSTLDRSIR